MKDLSSKVAWVTGAGSGIGEAVAVAFAGAGAHVVLTGRRRDALETVARTIAEAGGQASVESGDLTDAPTVERIAEAIAQRHGRLDILANNAGLNVPDRSWDRLTSSGIDALINGNLVSAAYVARAVLSIMRRQQDGVLIHTASWAGRYVGPVAGPLYIAAKHGLVAMSHTINLEECGNGIRSTVLCPAEVATPIMTLRDPPELPETMARMLQPGDLAGLALFVALQSKHVCINEVVLSPTHNRGYLGQMAGRRQQAAETRQKSRT